MIQKLFFSSLCLLSITAFATEFVITSTDDSGSGTLREALESLVDGDTITFDDALSGTITLASALPSITIDTLITGPTTGSVTIDGSSSYQIFNVSGFTTISNLTLANNDTSTAGSAVNIDDFSMVVLDNMTIPHCDSSCEAPVQVMGYSVLFANNVAFSSSGSGGMDVLFTDGTAGIFSCDSPNQPQIWIGSNGTATIYKEGDGILELKASSTIDITLIADEGTLRFSDTTLEPIIAFPNGTFEGTPTTYYVANMGIVSTGSGFGTITNTLDYYQTSGGVLVTKIDPSGSCDLVQATGTGYLDGNLIIPLQPGTYASSTMYTLLSYDSGYTTPFDNVYFDVPGQGLQSLTNASLNYNATTAVLEITSTFVIDPPENASLAKNYAKKMGPTSPVSRLFTAIVKEKKRPQGDLLNFLKTYLKYVQEKSLKAKATHS